MVLWLVPSYGRALQPRIWQFGPLCICSIGKSNKKKKKITYAQAQGNYRSCTTDSKQRGTKLKLWITTYLIESDVPTLWHPPHFNLTPLISITPSSTSHYNILAICLKIHEPAYVRDATFISIPRLLQTTPSLPYLPFAGNMPLLIFPHETDTRVLEPAPSPHIKNYFNSIDHKAYVRNKFQLEPRFQIVKMKSIGKGAEQGFWNRGWVWDGS